MKSDPFLPLLLITALAAIVPVLASRWKRIQIPIVVAEILAGVIIGRSGFDLIGHSEVLDFLAEFGFIFLMFLSGLEVDFGLLLAGGRGSGQAKRRWAQPLPMALSMLALSILLAGLGALGLRSLGAVENPLLMALILSTTSLGVVLPVLKERGLHGTRFGQYLLVAASVADFVTLFLLTVVIAAFSRGLTLDLLLVLVLLAAFAIATRWGKWLVRIPGMSRLVEELSHATAQIRVRGAFALMVAWVVLAGALGAEVILGAFLAGAVVGLLAGNGESELREKLDAIGFGFFIPIFFIWVGVGFNLRALFESPTALLLVALLVVIAYVVKVVPSFLLRAEFSGRKALAGGILLSSRLSLIIAAAAIALEIGAISDAVNAAVVLVAIVTCTLSPMVFNRLFPQEETVKRQGVIVIGNDQMSELLARRLRADGEQVVVLTESDRPVRELKRADVRCLGGSPVDPQSLERAGAATAAGLVALCRDPECLLRVCEMARDRFGIPLVVARVDDLELLNRLRAWGVRVVQPAIATAIALEGALRFPTIFDVLVDQGDGVEVGEAVLRNRELAAMPLGRIQLPGNALILSLRRDETIMVPDGSTVLKLGDRVALIGSREAVERAAALLETGLPVSF